MSHSLRPARSGLLLLSTISLAASFTSTADTAAAEPAELHFEKIADAEPAPALQVAAAEPAQLDGVTVTGKRSFEEQHRVPASSATVTAEDLGDKVNVVNTEDALKYLPSLLVRKRYSGDNNAPVATRTTGINASARSLVYADGLLLSTLVNNNNGNGSPQWFLVAPNEIDHIDVLYGPYSAAYPGNSYGAVIDISTRQPEKFEAGAKLSGSLQDFSQYSTSNNYGGYEAGAWVGDRAGKFSWRLSLNHLDSASQPITYVTINQSTTAATAAQPVVTGSIRDNNRTGGAIQILGGGNFYRTLQDNATLKLAYDITPTLRASYLLGYWQNRQKGNPETYLKDAAGNPYFGGASGQVNLNGFAYNATAISSPFSSNLTEQQHLAQTLKLASDTRGEFDWSLQLADFNYLKEITRTSTGRFPTAQSSGPGRINDAGGTGWATVDASGIWRPQGIDGNHFLSFGLHADQYTLDSPTFDSNGDWQSGSEGALFTDARGKTATLGLYAQDLWRVLPSVTATLGVRYEWWRAFDGVNTNRLTSGPNAGQQSPNGNQPGVESNGISPKLSIGWDITKDFLVSASAGRALRFPTVGELYQNVATGTTFTRPNPFLKPETVNSQEVAGEFHGRWGKLRLAVFQEQVRDALISQTSTIPGVALPVSFTQNVSRTRQRGIELSGDERDVLVNGLELQGSLTYVDAHILKNDGYVPTIAGAQSVGRRTPYVPLWRATLVETYHFNDAVSLALAQRYSARQYATVDNTDINPKTYQGFEGFFVVDGRINWKLTKQWDVATGVNNLFDRRYFLFHPFEARTVFAELKFNY